jgi:hypothetical protein|tara:strand:- start:775 stop:957 length:183 start_codon:yes stop_codon:yes gene_type:complete
VEPVASKSKKHFWVSIFKSILRLGACYGLWIVGSDMGDPVLQVTAIFFGLAEILGIVEEL